MGEETKFWEEGALDPSALSAREKELRDRFVEEYMFDYDARSACVRIGFLASMAEEYSKKFLDEAYVVKLIAQKQRDIAADPKKEEEDSKRQIRASLLREAHYRGPGSSHAARVAALARLSAQYGMDAPIKVKNEHLHKGGVMAVPGIASLEDWQKAALGSQGALVKDSAEKPDEA